jgi:hypothetical protein
LETATKKVHVGIDPLGAGREEGGCAESVRCLNYVNDDIYAPPPPPPFSQLNINTYIIEPHDVIVEAAKDDDLLPPRRLRDRRRVVPPRRRGVTL